MASGRLRRGLRTSPAMKVMSCQESAENNEPTCDTEMATRSPNTLPAMTPSDGSKLLNRHMSVKLVWMAAALRPSSSPAIIRAARATVLALVKTF